MSALAAATADLDRLNAHLASIGAIRETDDGFRFLDVDVCSRPLADLYGKVVSAYYANGGE
jgi:hypothetical protein